MIGLDHARSDMPTGWVDYRPLEPLAGEPGLVMEWMHPALGPCVVVLRHGLPPGFSTTAWMHAGEGPATTIDMVARALSATPNTTEAHLLTLALPGPRETRDQRPVLGEGLPHWRARREQAYRGVREARLPAEMEDALLACLDHGVPQAACGLPGMRPRGDALWHCLAFAARNPVMAWATYGAMHAAAWRADGPEAVVLSRWPGLTPAHLRRIRTLPPGVASRLIEGQPGKGASWIRLMAASPVDWMPGAGDWDAFEEVATALGEAVAPNPWPGALTTLAAPSRGDWTGFRARLRKAAGVGRRGPQLPLGLCAQDVRHVSRALSRQVVGPILASGSPRFRWDEGSSALAWRASAAMLYGGRSAVRAFEISRRWHLDVRAMEARVRAGTPKAAWPPLFEGSFRHGDVEVVAIPDYASLSAEGARGPDRNGIDGLNHCVATRMPDCISGKCHVLSLRRVLPDGTVRRLSTCEVVARPLPDGGTDIGVVEHRGLSNAEASDDAAAAVVALAAALREGRLAAVPGALVARAAAMEFDELALACGYDWRDPAGVANALAAWEPLLPRWARGIGPRRLHSELVGRGLFGGA